MTTERQQRIRKYVQSQAALQALKQREQQQRNPFDIQEQITKPEPKEEKKGFFSKVIDVISYPGELGMGLLTSAIKIPGIEQETDREIERGGVGTTKPVIERQRERRAELLGIDPKNDPWGSLQFSVKPTNWKDYAKATRQAYVEARDAKEYEMGIPFLGEVLTDPTTYLGGFAVKGVASAVKGTKGAVKAGSVKVKSLGPSKRLNRNAIDSTPQPKTSTEIDLEQLKDEGIVKRAFNNKYAGYLGSITDKIFGQTYRYATLNPLGKAISNIYIRMSDDARKAQIDKLNFNTSAKKDYGVESLGDEFENFFNQGNGLTPTIQVKTGKNKFKKLEQSDFKEINDEVGDFFKLDENGKTISKTEAENYQLFVNDNGQVNLADFMGGMFQKSVRQILDENNVKYIQQLTKEQIANASKFRIGEGFIPESLAFGVLKAKATLNEIMITNVKHTKSSLDETLIGVSNNDALKKFVNSETAQKIYFPHETFGIKTVDNQLKNTFDQKFVNVAKLENNENYRFTRTRSSLDINKAIEENKEQFHRIDDVIQLFSEDSRRFIREDFLVKDLDAVTGVNILSKTEYKTLTKAVDRLVKRKNQILNKKDIESFKGTKLENLLSEGDTATDIADSLGRRLSVSKNNPSEHLTSLQRLLGEGDISNAKLGRVFFTDEKVARKLAKALNIGDPSRWRSATKSFETANNVFRTLGTGFDFSWHLLQGLPILGSAFFNPKFYQVYGSSMKHAALAMINQSNLEKLVSEMDPRVVRDAIENWNINTSQNLTDAFAGTQPLARGAQKIEQAVGGSEKRFSKISNFILRTAPSRAQAAFQIGGDAARLKGVEILSPLARSSAKELVQAGRFADEAEALAYVKSKMGSFLTKATGGIDQYAMGLPNSQQAIERAFFLFSPSYQRASLSLIGAVLKGDIEGQLARRSLAGMAMLGTTIYVAQSTALGQEPKLDPSRGDFMSLRIGDSDVGIGGFYRGFLTFMTRMGDRTFTDENVFEQDQTHPFVSFIRGKVSPTSGLAWDLFEGSNYIGEPIEQNALGYGKAVGSRMLPFWAENVFVTDPLTGNYEWTNPNITGLAAELIGLRNIPLDVFDERRRVRDEEAENFYGEKWNDLNNVQREVLERESLYLKKLEEEGKRLQALRGGELQGQLDTYYQESERILEEFNSTLQEGVSFLDQGLIDLEGLRKGYVSLANSEYYTKRGSLRNRTEEGDLADVGVYWTQIAGDKNLTRKIDYQEDVLDVAYQDYITNIVINPEIQTKTGETDWYARDIALNQFENRWQEKGIPDVLNYVKARSYASKDLPPLVTELFMARDYYQYYWTETEKAALETINESDALLYKEYKLESNDTKKRALREQNPAIARIESIIRGARKELRKLDQGLDGFLYRWGYVTVLENNQNAGKEGVWKYPTPFTLEQYQGSL